MWSAKNPIRGTEWIGKSQGAITVFKQEEDHWPESKVFMDQMMKAAA